MSPQEGEARPRVLVTAEQASGARVVQSLEARGIEAVALPCLRVRPALDQSALLHAVLQATDQTWTVVTSPNGAACVVQVWQRLDLPPSRWPGRLAAVGPQTQRVLLEAGLEVCLTPDEATGAALGEALLRVGVANCRVNLVQGNLADEGLAHALSAGGAALERIVAYETQEGVQDAAAAKCLLEAPPGMAAVTLMSGSAARALCQAVGLELFRIQRLVCIGPATAKEVHALGAQPARIANPHSCAGLVQAVCDTLASVEGEVRQP